MKSINKQLALATCALLSQSSNVLSIENAWEVDSSALHYSEADDRVKVTKIVASVTGDVTDNDRVSFQTVLDTMSGATPSGAVKTGGGTSTSTGASGSISGSTNPNASALAEFDDTRLSNNLSWLHQYKDNWAIDYNAAVSIENDYRSFSGAITVSKETEKKDYKFTFGLAETYDQVFRVGAGDTPVPLSQIGDDESAGEGEKSTTDFIVGVSRILNKRTMAQVNFSYSLSNGYLTDPYKVFSVVDRATDLPIVDSSYYESRPDSRRRYNIVFNINHQTWPANNIIHASYRLYTDSWDVDSHTLDFSYRINLKDSSYFEPRLRLYQQSAASFYQNQFYVDDAGASDPVAKFPRHISADYRLDDMTSVTPGIHYGYEVGENGHFRMRIEYMQQRFEHSEFDTNDAIILQIAYSKKF